MKTAIFNRTMGFLLLVGAISTFFPSCSPYRIQSRGLKYARLGDDMPRQGSLKWALTQQADTLCAENGFAWKACRLGFGDGTVWVEESFDGSGKIGRVRVETPSFTVGKDIHVGQASAGLLAAYPGWTLRPYAEYQLVEATHPRFPHLFFLFSAPGMNFDQEIPELLAPEDIPQGSMLKKIVIM